MALRQGIAAGIVMALLTGGLAYGGSTAVGVQVPTLAEFNALEARVTALESAEPPTTTTTLPPSTTTTTLPPTTTTTTVPPTTTTTTLPPVVTNPSSVGAGVEGTTLNARAPIAGRDVAHEWVAPKDGFVSQYATYWVFPVEGYYKGDGGLMRITLREQLDGPVLAETTISLPVGGSQQGDLSFKTFTSPAQVVAGTKYWVQIVNVHPDSANNWTGIDGISDATGVGDWQKLYVETANGFVPANNQSLGLQPYADYRGTEFAAEYAMRYTDGTVSSQSPYVDPMEGLLPLDGHTVTQYAILEAGTLTDFYLYAEGSGGIELRVNGGAPIVAQGDGWLHWSGLSIPVDGMTSFDVHALGSYQVHGLWDYWNAADFGGGVVRDGASGWPIWGSNRNADLAFLAVLGGL